MATLLTSLSESLPPARELGEVKDPELQARAVLSLVLERIARADASSFTAVPEDPSTCPNCGVPTPLERSPYCSTNCREESGFVRQMRSAFADGSIVNPERQVGRGQALWHLLGGGYPLRQSLVFGKPLARVLARNEGRCEICGAPSTTIDHTGSG